LISSAAHIAMYIAAELTDCSLPHIAREVGKKDHTTVMYARDKVKDIMARDEAYRNKVRSAHRALPNGVSGEDRNELARSGCRAKRPSLSVGCACPEQPLGRFGMLLAAWGGRPSRSIWLTNLNFARSW
jgi:hypothetical protein